MPDLLHREGIHLCVSVCGDLLQQPQDMRTGIMVLAMSQPDPASAHRSLQCPWETDKDEAIKTQCGEFWERESPELSGGQRRGTEHGGTWAPSHMCTVLSRYLGTLSCMHCAQLLPGHPLICALCSASRLCPTPGNPMDWSPLGSSVHGIPQARILECVVISFSRGFSWPTDQTFVYWIGRQILYHWAICEALKVH